MIVDQFKIHWRYSGIFTTCQIDTVETDKLIAIGEVRLSSKDQYDKAKGRKAALKEALCSESFKVYLPIASSDKIELKKYRRKIWEAYRNMTRIPRW